MKTEKHDLYPLAIRYFEGRITPTEEEALYRFIHASAENKQCFRCWETEWAHSCKLRPDICSGWEQLQRRIHLRESLEERFPGSRPWWKRYWIRTVAAVALLLIACSTFLLMEHRQAADPELFAIETGNGEKSKLLLPDGTAVWLNAGSTLTYRGGFLSNREVELSGEAYFEVTRQADGTPFTVHTDRYAVRVTGTQFNVSSYPDEPVTKTTLLEGAIDILYDGEEIPVAPGEQLSLDKERGRLSRQRVDAVGYRSWTEGRMEYDRITLGELAGRLSRKYDVRIHLEEGLDREVAFRVSLRNEETVGDVLRALSQIIPIRYERRGEDIYMQKQ